MAVAKKIVIILFEVQVTSFTMANCGVLFVHIVQPYMFSLGLRPQGEHKCTRFTNIYHAPQLTHILVEQVDP